MQTGTQTAQRKKWRATWLRQLHQWHWISSALCLIGMLLFALTGITLNHAADIEARPQRASQVLTLPATLTGQLAGAETGAGSVMPRDVQSWLKNNLGVDVRGREVEWSARDAYVALPRPGGDAWLSIDRNSGEVRHETTDRGWIAYLNDLHKGRHTGAAWSWFIDLFAVACFVFCLTGLLLLQFHSTRRPATWPMVGLGFVIPCFLLVLLVH